MSPDHATAAAAAAGTPAGTPIPGDFGHPNQDLRRSIIIALYFAFIMSTGAVGLRLAARRLNRTGLFLDDYLIIVALLFKYGCSIGVVILLYNGLGSHITMIPPKNLEIYFKIGYSNPFVYTTCVSTIKLSILTLYRRLFPTAHMIVSVNLVSAILIVWTLGIYIASAMQCFPVAKFWNRALPGTCMDPAQFYYGMQIPNIITDVIVLVMPLRTVWGLQIPTTQRVLLCGVFAVGGLSWIFDIVRLVEMIKLTNAGPDITYNQVPMIVWTCIQAATGITAACLAHLRPLFNVAQQRFRERMRRYGNVGTVTVTGTEHSGKEGLGKGGFSSTRESAYELFPVQGNNV
ncbi:hypothetical protein BJX61DRAFT_542783 [Aspergillus egyptiacus]|nr:hypothetical protein BJX61DRAFT_542783 [Aspergillus egyptiacus]